LHFGLLFFIILATSLVMISSMFVGDKESSNLPDEEQDLAEE